MTQKYVRIKLVYFPRQYIDEAGCESIILNLNQYL